MELKFECYYVDWRSLSDQGYKREVFHDHAKFESALNESMSEPLGWGYLFRCSECNKIVEAPAPISCAGVFWLLEHAKKHHAISAKVIAGDVVKFLAFNPTDTFRMNFIYGKEKYKIPTAIPDLIKALKEEDGESEKTKIILIALAIEIIKKMHNWHEIKKSLNPWRYGIKNSRIAEKLEYYLSDRFIKEWGEEGRGYENAIHIIFDNLDDTDARKFILSF